MAQLLFPGCSDPSPFEDIWHEPGQDGSVGGQLVLGTFVIGDEALGIGLGLGCE